MTPHDDPTRRAGRQTGPAAVVIFGAAGDLTRRKLVPALYNLAQHGLLPDEFAIVGVHYVSRHIMDVMCPESLYGGVSASAPMSAVRRSKEGT